MKYKFKIKGLDCANCAASLEREINKIEGINEASVSFMTEKLIVDCDEEKKDDVILKVKKVVKREEPDCTLQEM